MAPINIQLDSTGTALFCSFSGFRPRLLPSHIARAYVGHSIDARSVYYVPPALMRLDAIRLEPDLSAMTGLQSLDVRGAKVTGDGVRALQKALPKCQVEWGVKK